MISTAPAHTTVAEAKDASWFTPGRFAALLAVLIVACFPQVVAGLETFFYRDFSLFGYPLAFYHRESFWRGEMPLWNPLNNGGLPFTAQWNTLTLYPPSLIYLLFPLSWSLGMFCLGHLFLAGVGTYHLARRWTGSNLAAVVAGTAFAFNGLTWHALMWPNDIAALGWMPWVVLAVERGWREGGWRLIVAGLAGAMQMLAGAPEVILQTWFIVGVLWLAQFFWKEISRGKMIARAMGIGGLVAALAAAQLLPFLDLLRHSQRDTSFGDSRWPMPAGGWGNYLVALFHCQPAGHGVYNQHDQYWTSSYFLGVGIVALALLAIWRVRSRRVWILAALTFFSLMMALGNNGFLFMLLKKVVPQIGFMRFPIKFVVLATFAMPLLAAHGMSWLRALPEERWPREWKRVMALGGVLLGLMAVIVCLAVKYPQAGDDVAMTIKSGARGAGFLVLIIGCVAWLHRKKEPRAQMILQCGLMILLWFDVFTHVPTLSPTVPGSVYEPDQMRRYMSWDAQLRPGESRAMQSQASQFKMMFGSVAKPADNVIGHRLTMFDNMNLLDHVPKMDGFYSLYLREMNELVSRLYYFETNDAPKLKDFMTVSHASNPTNELEWMTRDSWMPLITGGQKPVFVNDDAAVNLLFEPGFDGRKVVYLPRDAESIFQTAQPGEVKIESQKFSAQRIEMQVSAAAPAMVVVAQAFYHPWHAYVDGARVPLLRANHAFQALEVPAGRHRVELVYEDKMFHAGCLISIAACLGCAVASMLRRRSVFCNGMIRN
jgi:hypothetical protein